MLNLKEIEHKMELKRVEQIVFHANNKHRFKLTRNCSCCKRLISETDVKFIGETKLGVWLNCDHCGSTMVQGGDISFKGPQVALNKLNGPLPRVH